VAIWKDPLRCLGWIRLRCRPVWRPSPPAGSSTNRSLLSGSRLRRAEPGWRAAVLDERGSRQVFRLRASEEGSGHQAPASASGASNVDGASRHALSCASVDEVGGLHGAIRARDVPAADMQEKSTKRVVASAGHVKGGFVGFDEDGGFRRTSQRAERAIRYSERKRAEQSNPDRATRRGEEEGGDALFVPERRRSRRAPRRDPRGASEASGAIK
jgi:hypothetical protein